jgi:Skp family chaperone for outer membrane proteins
MQVRHIAFATLVALISLAGAFPAAAQDTVLLTIDLNRAQSETDLGQDIQRQVSELEDQFRTNLQSGGSDLQDQLQELQDQHEQFVITDEVYQQRMAELQQQNQQLQARYEVSNQAVQYARSRAAEAFFQAIYPDIEAVMDERHGTALAELHSLVASSDDIDITDDVIGRVNNRITELEVQLLPQRDDSGNGGGSGDSGN